MNTKPVILIALFSIIILKISALNNQKSSEHESNNYQQPAASMDHSSKNATLPWGMDWSNNINDTNTTSHHNSDDDGKSHCFHFEQTDNMKRGKRLLRFFAKFFLLIAHLSSLFAAFAYMVH